MRSMICLIKYAQHDMPLRSMICLIKSVKTAQSPSFNCGRFARTRALHTHAHDNAWCTQARVDALEPGIPTIPPHPHVPHPALRTKFAVLAQLCRLLLLPRTVKALLRGLAMYPLPPGEKALARRSRETCSACVCMGQREWVWVGFGAGSGVSTVNINFKPLPLCVCPCGNVRFFASRVLFLCVMRV